MVIGSWKLRESVAYGDGVGVSTEAVHMSDLSNIVIANLKWQKSRSEPT